MPKTFVKRPGLIDDSRLDYVRFLFVNDNGVIKEVRERYVKNGTSNTPALVFEPYPYRVEPPPLIGDDVVITPPSAVYTQVKISSNLDGTGTYRITGSGVEPPPPITGEWGWHEDRPVTNPDPGNGNQRAVDYEVRLSYSGGNPLDDIGGDRVNSWLDHYTGAGIGGGQTDRKWFFDVSVATGQSYFVTIGHRHRDRPTAPVGQIYSAPRRFTINQAGGGGGD